jgi:serine/threonine protein kinase
MPLAAYSRLGPYEILALVGAGGMGEVYRAHDSRLGRDVAIKVCAERFHERFEREARSVAALNHPNICTLYDVGANYLVMEFIDGKELRGPLPLETALLYARQICDALEAAHNKEITHRDLKPANILIAASGVKLLDFGIAKSSAPKNAPSDATRTASLTQAGAAIGTAAYMSPEQARGEPVDARSDIFSFGLVLYEMLTGRRAFSRNTPVETIAAILRDEPTPFDTLPGVAAVLARCLAKSPDARFQRIGDVRSSLDNLAGTSAEPHPSVAVLPFANMSSDKENEYFSDGLAEEILNLLAKISGLKVIARTSSFAFRGKGEDVRKIASALGVTHVLEGSVRRVGNRLRITAQLIQALDGTHVWSERYDRDLTDIFAIQDEIGEAIVEALKLRLAGRAATVNVEAYQHFLRAKYYADLRTPESLAKAKDAFEKALLIDPDYAAAHGGLASY